MVLMVIFSIVMGIGGVIMVWPDVVGFFTLKHKTELTDLLRIPFEHMNKE